jgi:membrane-bound lytic murein transglycosylase D
MLNRKLVAAGFFGNGLLLILAVHGSITTTSVKSTSKIAKDTAILQLQAFDSSVVDLNLSDSQWAQAPKPKLNKRALDFTKDYTKKNQETLEQVRSISLPYFAIMDSVFNRYNMPIELKYLAVIESELNAKAVSRVGAAGPWQLMPSTARLLSLKVKGHYDERKHYYKSTIAAARYLRDLYHEFNDWLLVIAAYNAGPARIHYAIKMSGSKNFWALQGFLPAETRGHVKKFIATQYFFEGHGSITTMTQNEVASFKKTLSIFIAGKKQEMISDDLRASDVTRTGSLIKSDKEINKALATADARMQR